MACGMYHCLEKGMDSGLLPWLPHQRTYSLLSNPTPDLKTPGHERDQVFCLETYHEPLQEGGCHCLFMHNLQWELPARGTHSGSLHRVNRCKSSFAPQSVQPLGKVLLCQRSDEPIGTPQKKSWIWCLDFRSQSALASLGFTPSLFYKFKLANSNLEQFC